MSMIEEVKEKVDGLLDKTDIDEKIKDKIEDLKKVDMDDVKGFVAGIKDGAVDTAKELKENIGFGKKDE